MFVPAPNKVFLKKAIFELRSNSGLFYPDGCHDQISRTIIGTVIAVGDEVKEPKPGDIVIFDPSAGMELIGSDHFDIADDGFPAVESTNAPSERRKFCIVDSDCIWATIENYEPTKIF